MNNKNLHIKVSLILDTAQGVKPEIQKCSPSPFISFKKTITIQ